MNFIIKKEAVGDILRPVLLQARDNFLPTSLTQLNYVLNLLYNYCFRSIFKHWIRTNKDLKQLAVIILKANLVVFRCLCNALETSNNNVSIQQKRRFCRIFADMWKYTCCCKTIISNNLLISINNRNSIIKTNCQLKLMKII